MDGLLGSEFALVLRDSLNSTPRRRLNVQSAPMSPVSTVSPISPQPLAKKPRGMSSLGLPLNIDTTEITESIPTSPTTPLPNTHANLINPPSNCTSPINNSSKGQFPNSMSSPTLSASSSSSSSSALSGSSQAPNSLPALHFSPMSLSSHLPAPIQPLDMLASVSAEQRTDINQIPFPNVPPPTAPIKNRLPRISEQPPRKSSAGGSRPGSSVTKGHNSGVTKTFRCDLCPSTFSQQFNLNKHVRAVHERRRPFQCHVCHARFQQKSHRTMHYLAVHEKLRQFSCDLCPASFSWRGVLKKHRKSIHGVDE